MEKTALFGFFFTLLFSFSSCGAESVLDLSKKEASLRLKRGDAGFILASEPEKMGELARIHPSAPFYAGLLVRSRQPEAEKGTAVTGPDGSSPEILAAALFEAALNSPAPRIQEEAARELFLPVLEGKISARRILDRGQGKNNASSPASGKAGDSAILTLRGAALYALNSLEELRGLYGDREPQTSWDRALFVLARADKEAARDFLCAGPVDGAYQWAFAEILNRYPALLTEFEIAAITGRFAVARSAFGDGLEQFRLALEGDPGLFFEYPDLITDLGRSFQFTPTRTEGINLFLAWDNYLT
ncbi:MAG: hypothetical protein LBT93_06210, partial [Treponema sp.]|nr:hypothetical protein [Treponema sp.]